jgi:hypothetical protein
MNGEELPAPARPDAEPDPAKKRIRRIGLAAGEVWQCLDREGPLPRKKLRKRCDLPKRLFHEAVGWLAREGKIGFDRREDGKTVLTLRPPRPERSAAP